jgi:predicted transposase YbfD/YdcC
VKGNQPSLLQQVKKNTSDEKTCIDSYVEETRKRGRHEIRKTFIYKDISNISAEWTELKRLIRVERHVIRKDSQSHETAYFISNLVSNKASGFAHHIRNHWCIENRLHWVKDVILKEDGSTINKGMAAENISILRNIVCNLFRANGHSSVKYAIELHANNFKDIFELINSKISKCKIT